MSVPTSLYQNPILGKNLVSVIVNMVPVAAGVLGTATQFILSADVETLKPQIRAGTDKIEGVNLLGENEVEFSRAASMSVSFFRTIGADDDDRFFTALAETASGDFKNRIFEVVWTEATSSGTAIKHFWGSFVSFESGYEGRGKQQGTLSMGPTALADEDGKEIPNFYVSS